MNTRIFYDIYAKYRNIAGDDRLLAYQKLVVSYFIESAIKGMLIYHQTGVGKTRVAVAIAETLRLQGYTIAVIEDKILHKNMRENVQLYGGDSTDYIFITRNASTVSGDWQRKLTRAAKLLVIFDEAHNFANSVSRGSKSAVYLYDQVRKPNCRVVCLSGTPAINVPHELAILFNMVSDFGKYTMFPEDVVEFNRYFIDAKSNKIANKTKFQARVAGYVSYYGDNYFRASADTQITKAGFPDEKPLEIVRVVMSDEQAAQYVVAREIELQEDLRAHYRSPKPARFGQTGVSGTYRIRTRQLSNFARADTLAKSSPKFCRILETVCGDAAHGRKSVIYTSFIDSGITELAKALMAIEWTPHGQHPRGKYTYAIITGQVPDDARSAILAEYNAATNNTGAAIMAVLVSVVAAQGIELKCTRAIHIVEFGWNYSLFEQIVARCVRLKSHADLPEEERTLTPYVYIATLPESYNIENVESTDEYMYNRAVANMQLINTFRLAIAEAAIDCMTFNRSSLLKCMFCKPTDERLYEFDIHEDMRYPCLCQPYVAKTIRADVVVEDGVSYYRDAETGKLHAVPI